MFRTPIHRLASRASILALAAQLLLVAAAAAGSGGADFPLR
ncbi:MAG TPA: hypothetical protein VLA76_09370 [Candidatus Angelobacter sp.]|nr:hypothetical protein [Candidatus Angelobacter sp.]